MASGSYNAQFAERPSPRYQLITNRFSVVLPDGWHDRSLYRFEGPLENNIQHNILISVENNVVETNLENYAQNRAHANAEQMQSVHLLRREYMHLENGLAAMDYVYRWDGPFESSIYRRFVFVLHNKTGYMLSLTFSKKTFKLMNKALGMLLRKFDFPGAKE